MWFRPTTGALAAVIMVTLSFAAVRSAHAQTSNKNIHRPHHTVHDRRSPCEKDPRCLESLSRAAAYGNMNTPHHPAAHGNNR